MPQAVLSILHGSHDSNRFPPLPMGASHFQFQVPVSNAGFWAFPSALQKLKGGMGYYSRNFNLDDAIRNAETP